MKCPKCGDEKHSVIDSRSDGLSIRRRRECQSCSSRFSTFERIEYALPHIIKKGGQREEFLRKKIKAGIVRACEKRPVTLQSIDTIVEEIERKVLALCVKEISSQEIGELMLEALRKLDKIAYIRFVSVYREFSNVEEFEELLGSLSNKSILKSKDLSGSKDIKKIVSDSIASVN
ncbi:UNVERIFIED_CONTAM: hypothetical protein GTU68_060063 [Idotea baltica]|nr:hypothetical protein [Idotea baltica]